MFVLFELRNIFFLAFAYLIDFGLSKLNASKKELDNEHETFLEQADLKEVYQPGIVGSNSKSS